MKVLRGRTSRGPLRSYDAHPKSTRPRRVSWRIGIVLLVGLCAVVLVGWLLARELRTSAFQARYLSRLSHQLTYQVGFGPSSSMRFPTTGPYNERLGYTHLPTFIDRLVGQNFMVAAQARLAPRLQHLIDWGLFPIYAEKTQAGLRILDRNGKVVFNASYPKHVYTSFEAIPKLIVDTLRFIENRELLDPRYPHRNPAVEWDRLARAILDATVQVIKKDHAVAGGSTLATQLEKFRHSPDGQTGSAMDKLRQMVSASLRAYQHGEHTLATHRQIILDYLNALPLAAQSAYGEVYSLGDGLQAWYHADFDQVNRVLSESAAAHDATQRLAYARAYRQVLSLLLAHQRPSFYLRDHAAALQVRTDQYLHLLSAAGLISPTLRDAALQVRLQVQPHALPSDISFLERKAANVVRNALVSLLGVSGLYPLDRLDLTVWSTLDHPIQEAVTAQFQQWRSAEAARQAGLTGPYLLNSEADLANVRYSMILYERKGQLNLLRIHTDNLDQPFDLNRGIKLDLGSTAKLRTLITYLELVAALHHRYARLPRHELLTVRVDPSDALTRWAVDYLTRTAHPSLLRMLDAAMARRYSASPDERFFTGGGLHTFENFRRRDDERVLSVQEAFRRSVNLVFIRLMRDIVRYHIARHPDVKAALSDQPPQAQNHTLLVNRFYDTYTGKTPEAVVDRLLERMRPTPQRFAILYGALEPEASQAALQHFLQARFPHPNLTAPVVQSLFERFVATPQTWAERGRLTALHPLELWVAAFLYRHPGAKRSDLLSASSDVLPQPVQAQHQPLQRLDRKTFSRLEADAFKEIHRAWQRLGYPFASLVPSYATAIGSSADRPGALAELMGIIVNNGARYPHRYIQQLHFASETPYETRLVPQDTVQQVLHPAIASVVKEALFDVVEQGTAHQLKGAFAGADGRALRLGGKTGTGDHRHETYGVRGQLLYSQAVNRTAVFVFTIDERFFGTLTVHVPGIDAANHSFTSALPVQVLKHLAPILQPLVLGTALPD